MSTKVIKVFSGEGGEEGGIDYSDFWQGGSGGTYPRLHCPLCGDESNFENYTVGNGIILIECKNGHMSRIIKAMEV